jgi:cobalt transporter subunit CbtB
MNYSSLRNFRKRLGLSLQQSAIQIGVSTAPWSRREAGNEKTRPAPATADHTRSAVAALLLGLALIFVVGIAPLSAIHNAAHDARHAAAFPCH